MNHGKILLLMACAGSLGACDAGASSARHEIQLGGAALPGKGDANGTGQIVIELQREPAKACYDVSVSGVDAPLAGLVRKRADDAQGEVAIKLFRGSQLGGVVSGAASGGGQSYEGQGCLKDPAPEVVAAILDDPSSYYVSIPTHSHPQGAIGGDLEP